ncbi:hypothetical protein [Luteimonas mephitis]|jgi:hypothetical protein|uniref:hypothetical protein n=1 Tax=Luteimonas mephitis TaxID=83615 RepID=UPI0012EB28F3|nr:hypothetical protein [Luteimonas mephitis]
MHRTISLNHCFLAALALALAGCVSQYEYGAAPDSATLRIVGNTANFFTDAYENEGCKPNRSGGRLATFYGPTKDAPSPEAGKTVLIPSGKPFVLTHRYIDARFAQNRICSVTVSFVPEPGGIYQTYFYVEPEVEGCDTLVSEAGGSPGESVSSFKYNEKLCPSGLDRGAMNRQPVRVNWKADVHFSPAR